MLTTYLCLEIAIKNSIKSYAGGLGILAGDTLKAATDLGLEMNAFTLLYKNGYFRQGIDPISGRQIEENDTWDYQNILINLNTKFEIEIENKKLWVQVWKYDLIGANSIVPVYFLDTNLDENDDEAKSICSNLYSRYEHTRLKQEILLGVGSILAQKAMNHELSKNYHLNESHAAFAIPYLVNELGSRDLAKKKIVFTTHTPLEHGHKKYPVDFLQKFVELKLMQAMLDTSSDKTIINMTKYCLENSNFANAVAKKHGEVMKKMFPNFDIEHITNGIHTATWISRPIQRLLDKYNPSWFEDSDNLRNSMTLDGIELWGAHTENKKNLIELVQQKTSIVLDPNIFTIGFARRVDSYKRQNFIFKDIERLNAIAKKFGGLQLVFSGKAYPNTADENSTIAEIYKLSKRDDLNFKVAYIPNYDMDTSIKMVSGADIWLNNPQRPQEASGTSGMKASLNGLPNFSVVDGWWVEGLQENITGWAIGDENNHLGNEEYELNDLYNKLESVVLPMYYFDTKKWLDMMRQSISINASYFNTQRMLNEYLTKAYLKN